jgi:hypothetical protein
MFSAGSASVAIPLRYAALTGLLAVRVAASTPGSVVDICFPSLVRATMAYCDDVSMDIQ